MGMNTDEAMIALRKIQEARKALKEGLDWLGLIGKDQPHLNEPGRLAELVITAKIHHQARPSAPNYHSIPAGLHSALVKVISAHFKKLCHEAMENLEADLDAVTIDAETALRYTLKQIEQLKEPGHDQ
jgi:hypothetical protein